MVRAILEGRKTQTRRVITPQPERDPMPCHWVPSGWAVSAESGSCTCKEIRCPYLADRLWVRETWASAYAHGCWGTILRADGRFLQGARQHETGPHYDADDPPPTITWRPSIFMPRWASRITLEITNVRVERLQAISLDDVLAEGFAADTRDQYWREESLCKWQTGWNALNAKRGYSWESSPWVWVIEFKKL